MDIIKLSKRKHKELKSSSNDEKSLEKKDVKKLKWYPSNTSDDGGYSSSETKLDFSEFFKNVSPYSSPPPPSTPLNYFQLIHEPVILIIFSYLIDDEQYRFKNIKRLRKVCKQFYRLINQYWLQIIDIPNLYLYLYGIEKGLTLPPKKLKIDINISIKFYLDFTPISSYPIEELIINFLNIKSIRPASKRQNISTSFKGLTIPPSVKKLTLSHVDGLDFVKFSSSLTVIKIRYCSLYIEDIIKKLSREIEHLEFIYYDNTDFDLYKTIIKQLPPKLKSLTLKGCTMLKPSLVKILPKTLKVITFKRIQIEKINNTTIDNFHKLSIICNFKNPIVGLITFSETIDSSSNSPSIEKIIIKRIEDYLAENPSCKLTIKNFSLSQKKKYVPRRDAYFF
jgi:hypothetical protein